ncbi:hypothetical protein BDW66DRAFT_19213 [Aspergillus desertorum]
MMKHPSRVLLVGNLVILILDGFNRGFKRLTRPQACTYSKKPGIYITTILLATMIPLFLPMSRRYLVWHFLRCQPLRHKKLQRHSASNQISLPFRYTFRRS